MKILINVPSLSRPGGVSVLYNVLRIENQYEGIKLFSVHSKYPSIVGWLFRYSKFLLEAPKNDIIHFNPSLNKKSFFREAMYISIALILKRKIVVYWHGWNNNFEEKIRSSFVLKFIFCNTYKKVDCSIVLGEIFSNKLERLGYKGTTIIETNAADSQFLSLESKTKFIENGRVIKLLFIARLEKEKGIYEAIQTVQILNKSHRKYELIIAGNGTEEGKIIEIAEKDPYIRFLGYIRDKEKHQALLECDILFFPTYYPEGLPLTILEGIMYGLPVVSRPVGGIPDVVKNDENGYLIESKDPKDFAKVIGQLTRDKILYSRISQNNIKKSTVYRPKAVNERLMGYYKSIFSTPVS